ncbi:hypothetical protein FE275_15045 [Pseudomonas koreensis]|nr:hypothetical protein FE275_15045 [Pseudomonas koreensis]
MVVKGRVSTQRGENALCPFIWGCWIGFQPGRAQGDERRRTDREYVVPVMTPSRAGSLPQGLRDSCGSEPARE